ncbi:MAG: hypothetical protein A3F18_06920 [Legionellales bacterium RIFCSPHIGHO2_12_FULL_37_14]|nr:MAG: hypothetical protein A3F18_06920 [Legionellales bacterium RIFCSPHIGHO2_12_FULL_37_14]
MQVYLVGGAVRDKLLGLLVKERDYVVVGATKEDMLAQGFKQVGRDFPVFLHPKTHEEYALARKERKVGKGYLGFVCEFGQDVTLEEDLLRRDLTINAIAEDANGNLIDPYGGIDDIKARKLRHVSPLFIEDPVRVLRLARFKAQFHHLGFRLDPKTKALVYKMVEQKELDALVRERVWREWERSFLTPNPEQFIYLLRITGALKVILPEIDALFGVPAKNTSHPEIDSGIHTMQVVERLLKQSSKALDLAHLIFAAFTHDLGKACTPKELWPSHKDHTELGEKPFNRLCQRLGVPVVYKKLAHIVLKEHINIHAAWNLTAEEILSVLIKAQVFQQKSFLEPLLEIAKADTLHYENYLELEFWQKCKNACLAINKQSWLTPSLNGHEIQVALRNARIKVINQVKRQFYEKQS